MNTHPSPSPLPASALPEVCLRITEAVMAHHGQNGAMVAHSDPTYEPNLYEAFQIAMQILSSLYPETNEWTGAEVRAFAKACGVGEADIALIHDDEPNAIY